MLRALAGGDPMWGLEGYRGEKGPLSGPWWCHEKAPAHCTPFGTPRCSSQIQPCAGKVFPSPGHQPHLRLVGQDAAPAY